MAEILTSLHGNLIGLSKDRDLVNSAGDIIAKGEAVGNGTPNGATVSAKDYSMGGLHTTVLTLASTPLPIVSVTTGNGVGGVKIYDFPLGRIRVLGTTAVLSAAIAAANQADFTNGTPEGDLGIGTLAPADADALGTDATDDNLATARAFTMASYADAEILLPSEDLITLDGTSTAIDMILTGLVNAADIDNDVTTEMLISGTVTCHWLNLGMA